MSTSLSEDICPADVRNGVHYPSSDGEPMGEGDWHFTSLVELVWPLRQHFAERDAYVASNMMLYYEEGNPSAVRAPDCMVILGVKNYRRRSFMTWEEGAVPSVIFELASPKTFREDLGPKRQVYARIGVPEYFLFDPVGDSYRTRRFRGFRLEEGQYKPMNPEEDGGYISPSLNLLFFMESSTIRIIDLETHHTLRTPDEQGRLYEAERKRVALVKRTFRRRLRRAERQIEEKTQLVEAQERRAEEQERIAEEQARIAEAERTRADAMAAEIERLKALIEGPGEGRP